MTVPAADEDKVFDDGVLAGFHLIYSRLVPRRARPENSSAGGSECDGTGYRYLY